jgi:hypothetical protein
VTQREQRRDGEPSPPLTLNCEAVLQDLPLAVATSAPKSPEPRTHPDQTVHDRRTAAAAQTHSHLPPQHPARDEVSYTGKAGAGEASYVRSE